MLSCIGHLPCFAFVVLVLFHIIYFTYKYLQSMKSMVGRYRKVEKYIGKLSEQTVVNIVYLPLSRNNKGVYGSLMLLYGDRRGYLP